MITTFIITYFILVGIDALWLGVIAKPIFSALLPSSFASHALTVPVALAAWLLMHIGLWVFVLPLAQQVSPIRAALLGALFGLCLYGVYELTNWAIFPHWSPLLVVIDMVWGATLCAGMSLLLRFLA